MRKLPYISIFALITSHILFLTSNIIADINIAEQNGSSITIANSYFTIIHNKRLNAGLPERIICNTPISVKWNDGVYHRSGFQIEKGLLASMRLANRPSQGGDINSGICKELTIVDKSDNRIIVKVDIVLSKLASRPHFIYYFKYSDSPIIDITVDVSQQSSASWSELRLFDLKFGKPFNHWFCSVPAPLINERWDSQYVEGTRNCKLRFDKEPLPGHWRIPREHKGQRWVAAIKEGTLLGLLRTMRIITKRGWYDSWPYISNDCANIRGVWLIPWEGENRRFRCWIYVNRLQDVRRQMNEAYRQIAKGLTIKMRKDVDADADNNVRNNKTGNFDIQIEKGMLKGIAYKGQSLLADESKLFEIEWKLANGKYVLTDSSQWRVIKTECRNNKLKLQFSSCKNRNINSNVIVTFIGQANELRGRIDISQSKRAGIWRVRFPIVKLAPFAKTHKLYLPVSMGICIDDVFGKGIDYYCPYPTVGATMQWLAVTGIAGLSQQTLSFAVYDDKPFIKNFIVRTEAKSGGILIATDWSVENTGVMNNTFSSSGPVVLRITKGNWADAFSAYKSWFYETKFAPIENPESARRVAFWFRSWHGDWKKPYETIAKEANVPIGMHSCTWFATNHDDYYPQYFPIREGFDKVLSKWKKDNWTVITYINGILHDAESLLFRMLGYKYALRDMDGKMTLPKFNKTVDAYMCVATDYWRKTMTETIIKLIDKIGVDGVYIDMVSGTPALCFDKSHKHPIGGGSWWIEGHRKIVNDCRRILKSKGKSVFFISEYPADCYAGAYNGFLFGTAEWYKDFVPIFQTLFDGKLILYAQEQSYAREPQLWRVWSARELCFGAQIGWFRTEEWRFQDNQTKQFVYKCAYWRNRLGKFIEDGTFVPGLRSSAKKMCYFHRRGWCITSDNVMSSCWRKGKEWIIILVNVSLKPAEISIDLHNLRNSQELLSALRKGKIEITRFTDNKKFNMEHIKFQPDEIIVLKLTYK